MAKKSKNPWKPPKYGVPQLAGALGIKDASVRNELRGFKFEDLYKTGGGWDFGSASSLKAVAKLIHDSRKRR